MVEKVSFIGYVTSDDDIAKDPSEVDAVLQREAPKLVKEIRSGLDFSWLLRIETFWNYLVVTTGHGSFSKLAFSLLQLTCKG